MIRPPLVACRSRTEARRALGFTVTELLVVVAIIALLIALLIVGLDKARMMARTASCLSNQRQIALGGTSYATDNGGAYASNRTSGGVFSFTLTNACGSFPILINKGNNAPDSYHSWTASYGTNMNGSTELDAALTKGRLYPYIGSMPVYKSPLDPTSRIRSYSLSGFVGGTVPEDSEEWANKWDDWFCTQGVTPREWVTTHVAHHKFPSQTIMSIVEDDNDGFNFNNQGWVIDPRPPLGSPPPPGTPNPGSWANSGGWEGWIDWPAFWHPSAITYSYVDGSTESYSMQNEKVVTAIQGPPGVGLGHRYAQPADNLTTGPWRRDWTHIRDRMLPGVIPPMNPRYQDQ